MCVANINTSIKGVVGSQVKFEVVPQFVDCALEKDWESKSTDWGFAELEKVRAHHQEGNVTIIPNSIWGVSPFLCS